MTRPIATGRRYPVLRNSQTTSTTTMMAPLSARLRRTSTMRMRHRVGAAQAEIGMIGNAPDLLQHPPATLALLAGRRDNAHGDARHVGQSESAVGRRRFVQRARRGDADLGEID